jgi:1,4-dihydroxy-2-naphthoate octaprenyltransferase
MNQQPLYGEQQLLPALPTSSGLRLLALFVRLGRPKYLLYSWILCTLGVVMAAYTGHVVDLRTYLHGLLFVWGVHLMTHYCNDYFDLAADQANPMPTKWTGGSRVLVEGALEPTVSLSAGFVLLFGCVALLPAMPRASQYVGITTIALAWFYTAPPFRLNYRGLGELLVTTVLNGCVPLMGYSLVTGELSWFPAMLLLPAFIVQYVRMTIMNLADYPGDRLVGKRTAVVVLGPRVIVHLHALGQATAYLLLVPALLWWKLPLIVALCMAMTSPLALWQVVRLYQGACSDPRTGNNVVFWASSHSSLVVVSAYVGLLLEGYRNGALHLEGPEALTTRLFVLPLLAYGGILLSQMRANRIQLST